MTQNKRPVEEYMEGFRQGDHARVLNAVFCDVFAMRGGKIRELTSYLMEVK
jgi:ketosteroid isomerase-like protein